MNIWHTLPDPEYEVDSDEPLEEPWSVGYVQRRGRPRTLRPKEPKVKKTVASNEKEILERSSSRPSYQTRKAKEAEIQGSVASNG